MTILDAMRDLVLFGKWFRGMSWAAWRIAIAALFGHPAPDEGISLAGLFAKCTGRTVWPTRAAREGWFIVGRRGGKTRIMALVAVFIAAVLAPLLAGRFAPGEIPLVMLLAADRRQARVLVRYIKAMLQSVPMLRALIARETADGVELTTGVAIEVHTASTKTTRGYSLLACICDELAFWRTDADSADPDVEILNAIRPALASVPGSMLLCISSPYARRGALWEAYRAHYGQDDDPIFVWQAPSRTMNPKLPQEVIDEAYARDPESAAAEYGAEFRSDLETFLGRDLIDGATDRGVTDRPPVPGVSYRAFCDPAGGSGADAMTCAIAHRDGDTVVIDRLDEIRPPFSPLAAVDRLTVSLRNYRIAEVTGDRYAGDWPRDVFAKVGITYRPAASPKSDLYREALPLFTARRVRLIDAPRLGHQFAALERRPARSGKDAIDHPPGAHDDCANAVAGVCALLAARRPVAVGVGTFGGW